MPCKLTGDWAKVKAFTKRFPKTLQQSLETAEKNEAKDVKEALTNAILNQELSHAPLKPDTIKKKGNSKILVDTGAFAESFTVVSYGGGEAVVPMGKTDTGITMGELALIHEYGTDKLVPRPTVKPVYRKVKPEVESDVLKVVETEIQKYK